MIDKVRKLRVLFSRGEEDDGDEPRTMTHDELVDRVRSYSRRLRKCETWQTYYDGAFVVVGVIGYAVFDKVFG